MLFTRSFSFGRKWTEITQFTGDSFFQSMMGHGLKANSQSELLEKLAVRGFLVLPNADMLNKLKSIDRAKFQTSPTNQPYDNVPHKQISMTSNLSAPSHAISTPQLHAQIISLLADQLGPGKIACEIGAGTGFLPACMHALGCAKVFAVESDLGLVQVARDLLKDSVQLCTPERPITDSIDAMYISVYFSGPPTMHEFLSKFTWSRNALVVASYEDGLGPDQQLVLLEKLPEGWSEMKLFRVMCEPMLYLQIKRLVQ